MCRVCWDLLLNDNTQYYMVSSYPANARHSRNVGSMLASVVDGGPTLIQNWSMSYICWENCWIRLYDLYIKRGVWFHNIDNVHKHVKCQIKVHVHVDWMCHLHLSTHAIVRFRSQEDLIANKLNDVPYRNLNQYFIQLIFLSVSSSNNDIKIKTWFDISAPNNFKSKLHLTFSLDFLFIFFFSWDKVLSQKLSCTVIILRRFFNNKRLCTIIFFHGMFFC